MFQFVLRSKKYGDKTVSIDDSDKPLLFKTDASGKDVHRYEWHLGCKNKEGKFYAFRYVCDGSWRRQTLSAFLTGSVRAFFADDNGLNCCRSNFITRLKKYGKPVDSNDLDDDSPNPFEGMTTQTVDNAWERTRKQLDNKQKQ